VWIKNERGYLVNTDYLETVCHHEGYTRGWYAGECQILAKGDVREKIADAIRNGDNFVEVYDYER
jgi:hypothetical protein